MTILSMQRGHVARLHIAISNFAPARGLRSLLTSQRAARRLLPFKMRGNASMKLCTGFQATTSHVHGAPAL